MKRDHLSARILDADLRLIGQCSLQDMQRSAQNLPQKQKRKSTSWKMAYIFAVFVTKVAFTNLI